ncbi:MAG: hypothetical protein K2P73_18790 [Lachnospiraceae bacterium]|jgi:hypothetical protein|nr:hypothetical protein [Lachnospiraceae bacterium]
MFLVNRITKEIIQQRDEVEEGYWVYDSRYHNFLGLLRIEYLCVKDGGKAKREEEAFLYVDLGVLGG